MSAFLKFIINVGFYFLFNLTAHSQTAGCTDPLATNYQAGATQNDGSCIYHPARYTPAIQVDPISDTLIESSGLQWADGYLWSFNDGGGAAAVYRMDTVSKALLQSVYLEGASNIDWEDIAFDGTYLYIGDFGNNANGARTDLKIYKFPLSAIPDYTTHPIVTISAALLQTIAFTYADQPQPPLAVGTNRTAFDCEAMVVEEGQIHLFSKNWVKRTTTHYLIHGITGGTYVAQPVESLATNYLVTAADKAPGFPMIILLGYQNSGTATHFIHLLYGYSGGNYFNGNKRLIQLPDVLTMGQAEEITFRDSASGYISNERFVRKVGPFTIHIRPKLRFFNIAAFTSVYESSFHATGKGNRSLAAKRQRDLNSPQNSNAQEQIVIDPVQVRNGSLHLPYTFTASEIMGSLTGKAFQVQGNATPPD